MLHPKALLARGLRRSGSFSAVATYTTKSGRVLTDADIEALADEAEHGYDVEHLVARHDDPQAQSQQPNPLP